MISPCDTNVTKFGVVVTGLLVTSHHCRPPDTGLQSPSDLHCRLVDDTDLHSRW